MIKKSLVLCALAILFLPMSASAHITAITFSPALDTVDTTTSTWRSTVNFTDDSQSCGPAVQQSGGFYITDHTTHALISAGLGGALTTLNIHGNSHLPASYTRSNALVHPEMTPLYNGTFDMNFAIYPTPNNNVWHSAYDPTEADIAKACETQVVATFTVNDPELRTGNNFTINAVAYESNSGHPSAQIDYVSDYGDRAYTIALFDDAMNYDLPFTGGLLGLLDSDSSFGSPTDFFEGTGYDLVPGEYSFLLLKRDDLNHCARLAECIPYASKQITFTLGPDVAPPIIAPMPNFSIEATSTVGALVEYVTPQGTDDVDGIVPVSCTPASGRLFTIGTTSVTCTASDMSGNIATSTFQVVVHAPPPSKSPADPCNIKLPFGLTVTCIFISVPERPKLPQIPKPPHELRPVIFPKFITVRK